MNEPDLLVVCGTAFTAVFVLLGLLAAVMRLLITIYPERTDDVDAAMLAAVSSAVASAYPGTTITKIEEES